MPINLEINALTYAPNIRDSEELTPLHERYNHLIKLEEQRNKALHKMNQRQQSVRKYFDQRTIMKIFQKGNQYYSGINPKRNHL
jgi:hypothetical protein